MRKGHILVEGHGEVKAATSLLSRMSQDLGHYTFVWTTPRRWKNLHQWEARRRGGIRKGVEFMRSRDVDALLILRDEDDLCPREQAPQVAERLRQCNLPFPVAYVLLHPEFEVLFLPCLDLMEPCGMPPGTAWDHETWESRRGVKEWLSSQLPRGRSYKPTIDQLPMTRCLDLERLRAAEVPCFGSLERALQLLSRGSAGDVYP